MASFFSVIQIAFSTNLKFLEIVSVEINFYIISTMFAVVVFVIFPVFFSYIRYISPWAIISILGLLVLFVLGVFQKEIFGLDNHPNRYLLIGIKAVFIIVSAMIFAATKNFMELALKSFFYLGIISASFFLLQNLISPAINVFDVARAVGLAESFSSWEFVDFKRGIGLSQSPFSYVLYLTPAIFAAMAHLKLRPSDVRVTGLVLAVFLATVWIRNFDTAWIGLGVGFAIYLALARVRWMVDRPVLCAMSLIVTVVGGGYLALWYMFYTDVFDGNFSALSRLFLWDVAMQLFKESPLVGQGFGSAGYAAMYTHISGAVSEFETTGTARDIHSDWYELLAEGGIFGIAGFALFNFGVLVQGLRNYAHSGRAEDRAFLATFFAFFCYSMTTSLYHNHVIQYTLAAVIIGQAIRLELVQRAIYGPSEIASYKGNAEESS